MYLDEISGLIDEGKIKSTLTKTYPFNVKSLSLVHKEIESNLAMGKLALDFEKNE